MSLMADIPLVKKKKKYIYIYIYICFIVEEQTNLF